MLSKVAAKDGELTLPLENALAGEVPPGGHSGGEQGKSLVLSHRFEPPPKRGEGELGPNEA